MIIQPGPPLRILHCFRNPIGGIFRHVRDLVEEHSAAGHQVGILCDSSTGGSYEDALFEALKPRLALGLTRLPMQRSISPSDMIALAKSYRHIKSLQPDILHGHGAKGGAVARMIGSVLRVGKSRVARVYSPHGGSLHFDQSSPSGKVVLKLERFQEHFSDAIVFVCDYERRTYEAKVGRPRPHWQVVYNGIREAEFSRVETLPDAADFLFIGMMRDMKGPDVFIDAFARTERRLGRPLSALLIGDGPDEDKYRALLSERGLSRRIRMMPAMPARQAFALAKTVVVPSRAEAMPYIVLEALAAGKAVIASRVGGIPEVLGEASPALASPGNAEDLSRIMVASATEENWRERTMPKPAAFKSVFSTSVMAGDMLGLYRELQASANTGR